MNEPATNQERELRKYRSRVLAVAVPVLASMTLGALLLLLFGPAFLFFISNARHALALGILALCAVCGALLWLLNKALRAMDDTRQMLASQLAELERVTPILNTDGDLAARLGAKFAERGSVIAHECDGYKSILATMSEGILVLDARRNVLFSNPALRQILNIPMDVSLAQGLSQMHQNAELLANVEMAIEAMRACSFELQLEAAGEPGETPGLRQKRFIQAHCAPFKQERQALAGAVAVLHDISDLRRLERMRTEFVSNVSHELRTPLTSLLGYLETLEADDFKDPVQSREFLGICQRQAENLGRIVEDLLRLSRLENPQSEIASAKVSLPEVIRSAVEQCKPLAAQRAIDLSFQIPEGEVQIEGDRGLLVQALGNLIENAINYNRDKGSVAVQLRAFKPANGPSSSESTRLSEGSWEIAVSDTGIGIPAHALPQVFERFFRVDTARSRRQGGTGLGLAIVKHIALAHGASVHVSSEPGSGSTFIMRFKGSRGQGE